MKFVIIDIKTKEEISPEDLELSFEGNCIKCNEGCVFIYDNKFGDKLLHKGNGWEISVGAKISCSHHEKYQIIEKED